MLHAYMQIENRRVGARIAFLWDKISILEFYFFLRWRVYIKEIPPFCVCLSKAFPLLRYLSLISKNRIKM